MKNVTVHVLMDVAVYIRNVSSLSGLLCDLHFQVGTYFLNVAVTLVCQEFEINLLF